MSQSSLETNFDPMVYARQNLAGVDHQLQRYHEWVEGESERGDANLLSYLERRPRYDAKGRLHAPNGNFLPKDYFDSQSDTHYDESMSVAYEDMTLAALADKLGEAEYYNDKTSAKNISDAMLDKAARLAEQKGLSVNGQDTIVNSLIRLAESRKQSLSGKTSLAEGVETAPPQKPFGNEKDPAQEEVRQPNEELTTSAHLNEKEQPIASPEQPKAETRKLWAAIKGIDPSADGALDRFHDLVEKLSSAYDQELDDGDLSKTQKQALWNELGYVLQIEEAVIKARQADLSNDSPAFFNADTAAAEAFVKLAELSGWDDDRRDREMQKLQQRLMPGQNVRQPANTQIASKTDADAEDDYESPYKFVKGSQKAETTAEKPLEELTFEELKQDQRIHDLLRQAKMQKTVDPVKARGLVNELATIFKAWADTNGVDKDVRKSMLGELLDAAPLKAEIKTKKSGGLLKRIGRRLAAFYAAERNNNEIVVPTSEGNGEKQKRHRTGAIAAGVLAVAAAGGLMINMLHGGNDNVSAKGRTGSSVTASSNAAGNNSGANVGTGNEIASPVTPGKGLIDNLTHPEVGLNQKQAEWAYGQMRAQGMLDGKHLGGVKLVNGRTVAYLNGAGDGKIHYDNPDVVKILNNARAIS